METLLHQPIVTAALALLGLVCLGHLAYCTLRSALMGLALAGLAALLASQSGAWVHVSGAFRRWLFSLLLLGGFDQASAVEIGVQAHPRPFGFDASSPAAEKTMDSLLDRMAPFVSQPMSWCAVTPTGYNVTRPLGGVATRATRVSTWSSPSCATTTPSWTPWGMFSVSECCDNCGYVGSNILSRRAGDVLARGRMSPNYAMDLRR